MSVYGLLPLEGLCKGPGGRFVDLDLLGDITGCVAAVSNNEDPVERTFFDGRLGPVVSAKSTGIPGDRVRNRNGPAVSGIVLASASLLRGVWSRQLGCSGLENLL